MSSKRRRSRSHRRHRRDRGLYGLVILSFVVVAAIFAAGFVKSRLKPSKTTDKNVEISAGDSEKEADVNLGSSVTWQGKTYEARRKMDTILFLGVDRSSETAAQYDSAGQNGIAEVILLLVADGETKETTLIGIPADTLIQLQKYNENGNPAGMAEGYASLQFSYGKSARDGCRLTAEQISGLLQGIHIDGTISLTREGLEEVVDRLGGVDAEIPEDMSDLLDFMKALYRKAKSGSNVAELLDEVAGKELYNGVELETLINLFTCTVKDEIVQIPGDRSGEDGSDGFRVDRDGMTELLLKLFYDETMEEN